MSQQNVNTTASESKESSLEIAGENVSFFSNLHVRDRQGNYVMATASQILTEATRAIDFRYPTGTFFDSSAASAEFFGQNWPGVKGKYLLWRFSITSISLWRMKSCLWAALRLRRSIPGKWPGQHYAITQLQ